VREAAPLVSKRKKTTGAAVVALLLTITAWLSWRIQSPPLQFESPNESDLRTEASAPPGLSVDGAAPPASSESQTRLASEPADADRTAEVEAVATLRCAGQVLDAASGEPIGGASVVLGSGSHSDGVARGKTDARGGFRLQCEGPTGDLWVLARHPGFLSERVQAAPNDSVTVRLGRGKTLSGRVISSVDETGLCGVRVLVRGWDVGANRVERIRALPSHEELDASSYLNWQVAETDESGAFSTSGIAGTSVALALEKPGWQTMEAQGSEVLESVVRIADSPIEWVMEPALVTSFVVRDATTHELLQQVGWTAAGIIIAPVPPVLRSRWPADATYWLHRNRKGYPRHAALPKASLTIGRLGYSPVDVELPLQPIDPHNPPTPTEVLLQPTSTDRGTLHITLNGRNGELRTPTLFQVSAVDEDPAYNSLPVMSAEAEVSVTLPPGRYRVAMLPAADNWGLEVLRGAEIQAGRKTRLSFDPVGGTLLVHLLDQAGQPIGDAALLRGPAEGEEVWMLDADRIDQSKGSYAVRLSTGRHWISAAKAGYEIAGAMVDVVDYQETKLELRLNKERD
jgi:hypothetical protein